ncbi:hypothetical protein, partial [Klebsiella aerogenes]|uniref:hypothetical protein n=1 Tax=Klebsiella aerogenes TaxID=548 RepID=UPI0019547B23
LASRGSGRRNEYGEIVSRLSVCSWRACTAPAARPFLLAAAVCDFASIKSNAKNDHNIPRQLILHLHVALTIFL